MFNVRCVSECLNVYGNLREVAWLSYPFAYWHHKMGVVLFSHHVRLMNLLDGVRESHSILHFMSMISQIMIKVLLYAVSVAPSCTVEAGCISTKGCDETQRINERNPSFALSSCMSEKRTRDV